MSKWLCWRSNETLFQKQVVGYSLLSHSHIVVEEVKAPNNYVKFSTIMDIIFTFCLPIL